MAPPFEEEPLDVGSPEYDFIVRVDFDDIVGTVQPLSGVNRGVRAADGACQISDVTEADFSSLFTGFGVQSVRTHEGGYNISQILWPPTGNDVETFRTVGGVSAFTFNDVQDTRLTANPVPPFGYNSAGIDECGGLGNNLFEDDDTSGFTPETPYFFWYPEILIPFLFQRYFGHHIDLDTTGAGAGYRGLAEAQIEIYFRLGEGSKGPTYIGAPWERENFSSDAKTCYAQIAARIVRELAESCAKPTVPGFIDLWNEAFTGPFHTDISDADALTSWALDYATFFNAVHEALVSPQFPYVPFEQQIPGIPGEEEGGIDLSGVRFGGFSFLGGDMRRFAEQVLGEYPLPRSRVYQLLSEIDHEKLSFLSFHLYELQQVDQNDNPVDDPFSWFDDLSTILEAIDTFRADQANSYEGLRTIHLTEWGYRLPKDDRGQSASVFGGSFVSAGLTWMQYAQTEYDGLVERAHLWGGSGRKTGIFTFARLRHEIPGGSSEMYMFFIRTSAVALLFHSSIEGWDLASAAIRRGWSLPGHHAQWHDPLNAAEARMDITALAARNEESTGSTSRVVLLSNLTEGSKRISLELVGLSPGGKYSVTIIRTNETALGRTESYVDLDGDPFETFEYKGHPVAADAYTSCDLIQYFTLSESAVGTALSEVRVVSHTERVADLRGELVLEVEFPNDYGVMKIVVDDSARRQAGDTFRADTGGDVGARGSDRKNDE